MDLQYDLLYYLFTDSRAVFTDPYVTLHGERPGSKVTFRDLYVNALVHSPRCSKVSRDKLLETPAFADEFAKISLLSNVGRINTTMACEWNVFLRLKHRNAHVRALLRRRIHINVHFCWWMMCHLAGSLPADAD